VGGSDDATTLLTQGALEQQDVLVILLKALKRAHGKAMPLLANPGLLDQEGERMLWI
jgi:hypothetical protein